MTRSHLKSKSPAIDCTKLAQIMSSQDIKQWWLAEQLKISRRTLSRWLQKKTIKTTDRQLKAIAAILNISPDLIACTSATVSQRDDHQFLKSLMQTMRKENVIQLLKENRKWQTCRLLNEVMGNMSQSSAEKINATIEKARSCLYLAQTDKALDLCQKALLQLRANEGSIDPGLVAETKALACELTFYAGRLTESVSLYEQLKPSLDLLPLEIQVRMELTRSSIYRLSAEFSQASKIIDSQLKRLSQQKDRALAMEMRCHLAMIETKLDYGQFKRAATSLKAGLSIAHKRNDTLYRFLFYCTSIEMFIGMGQTKKAESTFKTAEILAKQIPIKTLSLPLAKARLLQVKGDHLAAHKLYASSLKLAINRGLTTIDIYEQLVMTAVAGLGAGEQSRYLKKLKNLYASYNAHKRLQWLEKRLPHS